MAHPRRGYDLANDPESTRVSTDDREKIDNTSNISSISNIFNIFNTSSVFNTTPLELARMPISGDRFEELDQDDGYPRPGTNAATILDILRRNADAAFTQSEIVDRTGVTAGSVGPTLVRLRERGRVDHRGTYWRISDHDRSVDAATAHGASTADSHEGPGASPPYEEWQEHAVDPRDDGDG